MFPEILHLIEHGSAVWWIGDAGYYYIADFTFCMDCDDGEVYGTVLEPSGQGVVEAHIGVSCTEFMCPDLVIASL